MWFKEKCPYYKMGLCSAYNDAPVIGGRLDDCQRQEHTDRHCNANPGSVTTVNILIPVGEFFFYSATEKVFIHEMNSD